ncbi:hypothetical protein FJZ22_02360 [Candidatus Pacearchaeota archaeon]|nr:hypothetical protein [Candidatus Pacearchaeota archaeon]
MNNLTLLIKVIKEPKHLTTLVLTLGGFYILNALIANMGNLWEIAQKESLLNTLMYLGIFIKGFSSIILPSTLITLLITGTLMGVLFTLLDYNYNVNKTAKVSGLAKIGLFFGTVAPGCAAYCGIGLAAALSIGTVFAALPFQGKEISYFVIGFLVYSINKTLTRLTKGCTV